MDLIIIIQPVLLKSKLYEVLNLMPKGALHHIHSTAVPSADFYIKLTYNDFVYYNERERLFKVAPVSEIQYCNKMNK